MGVSTATTTPIPHPHVQRPLTVVASPTQVRLLAGAEVIATPPRRYDQAAPIEQPAQLEALTAVKRQTRYPRGQDRLTQATPASRPWLSAAAERGQPLGAMTAALLELLDYVVWRRGTRSGH